MRIVVVTAEFPPRVGGIQTYARDLAIRLAERAEQLTVVTTEAQNSAAVDAALPFRVHRLHVSENVFPFVAWVHLARLGSKRSFDVAFCTSWVAAAPMMLAKWVGGPRQCLVAAHGRELIFNPFSRSRLLNRCYDRLRRLVLRKTADQLFPVSRYTAGLLAGIGVHPSKMVVLPNGTDPNVFFPEPGTELRKKLSCQNGKIILTVSRLQYRKGIDLMICALPEILRRFPGTLYVIVGDGPQLSALRKLALNLDVAESVLFVGDNVSNQLRDYYNASDVFVLPARETKTDVEGFGIVFLEASACEVPVVGTRTGGIPDAVIDRNTGILVEPESVESLAGAITGLLSDPEEAARLGRNGRDFVETKGNWDVVSDRLYESMRRGVP